jgi:hypothetical protein
MKTLVSILRELVGLFVDDGLLALAIGVVVVSAAFIAAFAPFAAGIVLSAGCLSALVGNVVRAGKR